VCIHSKSSDLLSDVEVHKRHIREILELMREHKLFANIRKCIFGAPEIPVLGCLVGKNGVRPDPEKIRAIAEWPVPRSVKDLRKFLDLVNYLHKYSKNSAHLIHPLSQLLRKDVIWKWSDECQAAFTTVKQSLTESRSLRLRTMTDHFMWSVTPAT